MKIMLSRKTLINRCSKQVKLWVSLLKLIDPHSFFDCLPLSSVGISLALGASYIFGTVLPMGPSGERNPFQFLECDVQGGDVNQIEDADTAIAFMLGQLPFLAGQNEPEKNVAVSLSWPENMEVQDLYPVTTSTYTWPTGTTVEVPCYAQDKVVEIVRVECPDSFVNPIDPNHLSPCVKVLHRAKYILQILFLTFSCHTLCTQSCPAAAYADEEYTQMWAASNSIGLIALLLNLFLVMTWYIILCLLPICIFHRFIALFCVSLLMWMQVSRKKKVLSSCSIPSKDVYVRSPPVRRCGNSSVNNFKVRFTLLGMQNGRMVKLENLQTPTLCYFYNSSVLSWFLSTGNGIMCAANRSSVFILLSIQIHLCDLSRALYTVISVGTNVESKTKVQTRICRVLSMGLPILLLVISYGGLFEFMYIYHSVAYIFIMAWKMHTISWKCWWDCR